MTIATDFSSAAYAVASGWTNTAARNIVTDVTSKAAGTVELRGYDPATQTLDDPSVGWDWAMFGDL